MTDLSKLKSTAGKSKPPPPKVTTTNLKEPPSEAPAKVRKTKIAFSVPECIADQSSREAGERIGFKKGPKSDLLLAMSHDCPDRKEG